MNKEEKMLSKKVRDDGKSQVIVRFIFCRTFKPQIKTGVFVEPQYFEDGDIRVPKPGKLNLNICREVAKAKSQLDTFCAKVKKIRIIALEHDCESLDFIMDTLRLEKEGKLCKKDSHGDVLNYDSIQEAKKLETQIQKQQESIIASETKDIHSLIALFCKRRGFADSRTKVFGTLSRMIRRYELFQRIMVEKNYVFNIDTFSKEDMENFRDFIRNEDELSAKYPEVFTKIFESSYMTEACKKKKDTINERGDNYLINIFKRFKAFFSWANEAGFTTNMPFVGFEIGTEIHGDPIYITVEERNKIAEFDLSGYPKRVQEQRDIFVFQCLVGCRVSDLVQFTSANINEGILIYVADKDRRKKQQTTCRVPLNERAIAIIKKYEDDEACRGMLLPFISSPNYNMYIKQIFSICGITRNVVYYNPTTGRNEIRPINELASSHMARRTFCGNTYRIVKDPSIVGKMSGHAEGSRAFARYRNIDDDLLRDVINGIS